MCKKRGFSYYDIEQFLREAGAEKINEKAIVSFEQELEGAVKELIMDAQAYANYAGRKRLITCSDVEMVQACGSKKLYVSKAQPRGRRVVKKRAHLKIERPTITVTQI